jgi:hypothetical protein
VIHECGVEVRKREDEGVVNDRMNKKKGKKSWNRGGREQTLYKFTFSSEIKAGKSILKHSL